VAAVAAVAVAEPEVAAGPAPDLPALQAMWPAVVETVQGDHALVGALLADGRCVGCGDETVTVAFASSFLKRGAEKRENREIIARAVQAVTGRPLRLEFELRDDLPATGEAGEERPLTEEEWVQRFLAEFGAEEIDHDGESET
jgi:hypothetical protein